jgi:4-hydroxy-tetrahydrodipicolinate reductase
LDAEAKDWGLALLGTGVNPGFVMDKLVVTLAGVSQRIDHQKGRNVQATCCQRV